MAPVGLTATTSDSIYLSTAYYPLTPSLMLYVRPACFFVHEWRRRGRHEVCSVCNEVRNRVDVSRRRAR